MAPAAKLCGANVVATASMHDLWALANILRPHNAQTNHFRIKKEEKNIFFRNPIEQKKIIQNSMVRLCLPQRCLVYNTEYQRNITFVVVGIDISGCIRRSSLWIYWSPPPSHTKPHKYNTELAYRMEKMKRLKKTQRIWLSLLRMQIQLNLTSLLGGRSVSATAPARKLIEIIYYYIS